VSKNPTSHIAQAARKLVFPGLFTAFGAWEKDETTRGFRHHLERGWQTFGATAVFCAEGRPTVFFTRKKPHPETDASLHRKLWNFSGPTILVIEDVVETRLLSAFATPFDAKDAVQREAALIDSLSTTAFVTELAQFLRSVASGAYYRRHPTKFEPKRGIDHFLLANLCSARDRICAVESSQPLDRAQAQGLLGRCLFVSYLRERGIIDGRDFKAAGGAPAPTLAEFLHDQNTGDAARSLRELFLRLDAEFNGSLFGGPSTIGSLRRGHIDVLADFLNGYDFATTQPLLPGFPAYDFSIIPIELISAIYEEFIGAEHEAAAPDEVSDENGEGDAALAPTQQEKLGAYYTPPPLAELVVDIATAHRDGLLGRRCLDPSVGSGIFLVVLFQRMVAEWFARHVRRGRAMSKKRLVAMAREFRTILAERLCGVDCDADACHVACFSLYLAYLDCFPEPRLIREVSKLLKGERVLPELYFDAESPTTADVPLPKGGVIRANFFNPRLAALTGFDYVAGNPPWTGRRQGATREQEQWLRDKTRNPWLVEAGKGKAAATAWFSPNEQVAIGFLWKVPMHLAPGGKACLLLPSRILFADQTDQFQAAWFSRFAVDTVWQLADFRRILFKNAICPALVLRFGRREAEQSEEIRVFSPLAETSDPRRGTIVVTDDDLRYISSSELASEARQGRAAQWWKSNTYSTERDRRIIRDLMRMPRLSAICGEPEENKQLVKGQGFQPAKANDTRKDRVPWTSGAKFLDARRKDIEFFLSRTALDKLPNLPHGLRRNPSPRLFEAPLVLVNQGFSKCAFSRHDVVFQHALQSIAGKQEDEPLLLFLTAVLNTALPEYFLFHTSANIGIERPKALLKEVVALPFPLPEQTRQPARSRKTFDTIVGLMREAETALLTTEDFGDRHAMCAQWREKIAPLVYDYYQLAAWERRVIEESVSVFRKSIQPTTIGALTKASREPADPELEAYAKTLCETINRRATYSSRRVVAQISPLRREGIALLTLLKRPSGEVQQSRFDLADATEPVVSTPGAATEKLLARLSRAAREEKLGCEFLRGFALFTDTHAYIIKRLTYRAWSQTAALNDADTLCATMLNIHPGKA
jgi:hypothetical protein